MAGWKILIADDDDAVRRLLALAVRSFGHETVEALDGQHAVDMVMEHEPDAVFLDVLMPRLNGFDALARLRSLGYAGKVVMVTALSSANQDALGAGATPDALLAKPFRRRDVELCLERLAAG
ncbi:MAG TPA: response regulator [Vulgatibacter sp.]|nr:response regulator [Vulgatibacter sp.]